MKESKLGLKTKTTHYPLSSFKLPASTKTML